MRILLIIHNYPPHHIAGTEQYTVNIARELSTTYGHEVAVLHPVYTADVPDFTLKQRRSEADIPVYEILGGTHELRFGFGQQPARQARFIEQVNLVLEDFRPDIAHIQHLMGFPILPLLHELKARGLPILYTLHDFWLICPRYHLLRADDRLCQGPRHGLWTCTACRLGRPPLPLADTALEPFNRLGLLKLVEHALPPQTLLRAFLRRDQVVAEAVQLINTFISPSRALAERIQAALLLPSVQVIPPGQPAIDIATPSGPRQASAAHEPLQVGYLGTFAPHKGLNVLVEAMRLLAAHAPEAIRLHMHGYGEQPFTNWLTEQAATLPNLILHGRYSRSALGDILSNLDVIVVPSICFENAPTVIGEAFLHGVPVIGADLGGIPEMLDSGGLLVPPGDPQALADTLLRLHHDPHLLHNLRNNIPPVPSLAAHMERLLTIYEEALTNRST